MVALFPSNSVPTSDPTPPEAVVNTPFLSMKNAPPFVAVFAANAVSMTLAVPPPARMMAPPPAALFSSIRESTRTIEPPAL